MNAKRKWKLAFFVPALLLVAAGVWQAYAPYMGRVGDAGVVRDSIVPIAPAALAAKLKRSPHIPTVLYVYASWCPVCRQVTPHLTGIIREHEFDGARFLFVSIDESETDLMDYLMRMHYDGLFTPYIASSQGGDTLARALGTHYNGSIPYLAFFDGKGRLAQEFSGLTGRDAILGALGRIQK